MLIRVFLVLLRSSGALLGVGLGVVLLTWSSPGAAREKEDVSQPIFVGFEYDADERCPGEEHAFSLVHRRSRRVLRARDSVPDQILAMQIRREKSEYRGILSVTRGGQTTERRAMTGIECAEVVEALALTAALSIDPSATLTLGPPDDAPGVEPGQAPQGDSGTVPSLAPEEARDVSEPARVSLGPSFSLHKFMDHAAHYGLGAVLGLGRDSSRVWFPLEFRLSFDLRFETTNAEQPSVTTRFTGARLAYCPLRLGRRNALLFCPVGVLGALQGSAKGFEDASKKSRLWGALGLDAVLRSRLARHAELWLTPSLTFPTTRREFAVSPGPEVVASTLDVAWSVTTGVSARF